MNTPNPTPIAESLKSILVIAEQSRNTENACDLIAKIANDALTRPSPSADDGDVVLVRKPRPYPPAAAGTKYSEAFSFEGGTLTVQTAGYGDRDGHGWLCFEEGFLDVECPEDSSKVFRIANLEASELIALRDKLNELWPLSAAPSRAAPAGDREGLEPLLTELAKPQFMTSTSHGSTHTVEFTFMGADGSTRRNSLHDALINAARYARALPAAPQAPVSAPIADGEEG